MYRFEVYDIFICNIIKYNIIYIYIYIIYTLKHFHLKRFDISLLQLRFSDTHFNFFDILQVCYNKTVVI